MKLTRGRGSGSTNAGMKDMKADARRPPKVKDGVANDVAPTKPRSAVMPRPTKDTTEPYRSKPGATTSPSNTIPRYTGQPVHAPRPQGGTPMGHPAKTPRPSRG
jgi:hypothetical protein